LLEEGTAGFVVGSGKSVLELERGISLCYDLTSLVNTQLFISSQLFCIISSVSDISIVTISSETRRSRTRVAASGMSNAFVLDLLLMGESWFLLSDTSIQVKEVRLKRRVVDRKGGDLSSSPKNY